MQAIGREIHDDPVDAETFFHNTRCYGLSPAITLWFTWHHVCKGLMIPSCTFGYGTLLIVETMISTSLKISKNTGWPSILSGSRSAAIRIKQGLCQHWKTAETFSLLSRKKVCLAWKAVFNAGKNRGEKIENIIDAICAESIIGILLSLWGDTSHRQCLLRTLQRKTQS